MNYAEKNIVEAYARLMENLSSIGKIELLEKLAKSLKKENKSKEKTSLSLLALFLQKVLLKLSLKNLRKAGNSMKKI